MLYLLNLHNINNSDVTVIYCIIDLLLDGKYKQRDYGFDLIFKHSLNKGVVKLIYNVKDFKEFSVNLSKAMLLEG